MDMEIARLANVPRLMMTDRQMIAIRSALISHCSARTKPSLRLEDKPRRLPMLDWPLALFKDEEVNP